MNEPERDGERWLQTCPLVQPHAQGQPSFLCVKWGCCPFLDESLGADQMRSCVCVWGGASSIIPEAFSLDTDWGLPLPPGLPLLSLAVHLFHGEHWAEGSRRLRLALKSHLSPPQLGRRARIGKGPQKIRGLAGPPEVRFRGPLKVCNVQQSHLEPSGAGPGLLCWR